MRSDDQGAEEVHEGTGPVVVLRAPALLLAALFVLAGCPPCLPAHALFFAEDFEGCDGTCGWEVENGQGEIVPTVHPAEHGLRLTGIQAAAGREVSVALDEIQDGELEVELTSSCRAAHLTLALQWEDGLTEDLPLEDHCAGSGSSFYCTLSGEKRLGRPPGSTIRRITIKTVAGCTLDQLVLYHDLGGGC